MEDILTLTHILLPNPGSSIPSYRNQNTSNAEESSEDVLEEYLKFLPDVSQIDKSLPLQNFINWLREL